jgi:hypothetical protein
MLELLIVTPALLGTSPIMPPPLRSAAEPAFSCTVADTEQLVMVPPVVDLLPTTPPTVVLLFTEPATVQFVILLVPAIVAAMAPVILDAAVMSILTALKFKLETDEPVAMVVNNPVAVVLPVIVRLESVKFEPLN